MFQHQSPRSQTSSSKAEATKMIDTVLINNKFFTTTSSDKNPAEISGSALKNFHRKNWKSQQSRWKGRRTSKMPLKYQGKEPPGLCPWGILHFVSCSSHLIRSFLSGAIERYPFLVQTNFHWVLKLQRANNKQSRLQIFLLLPWDTVCTQILVFWELYTLTKLSRVLPQQTTSENLPPVPYCHFRIELSATSGYFTTQEH